MVYSENDATIISEASELISVAYKSGSIDTRVAPRTDELKQPTLSSELCKKLYGNLLAFCSFSVPLCLTRKHKELIYTVEMLADSVFNHNGETRVDIIRTVRKYDFYSPVSESLLCYAKLCAFSLATKKNLDRIKIRIYYVFKDKDEQKIKHFDYLCSRDKLSCVFDSLLEKVYDRANFAYKKSTISLPSASNCVFPYKELREGQEIMIKECYRTIKQGKRLFLEAPTGTGKTIAALYPAVRAVGNGIADKVFYLTSKASTRREAFTGAHRLFEAGVKLRTIVIGAKEQVCACAGKLFGASVGSLCNPDDCPYAKNYYDKVEGALFELINGGYGYTLSRIGEVAKKHKVCPYELSLDLSELCDVIICDYNYAFDPSVYFRRYFSYEVLESGKYIFLVDEAHNLVDRARDMYSASFATEKFEKLSSLLTIHDSKLKSAVDDALMSFRSHRALCRDTLCMTADGIERGYYVSNNLVESVCKQLKGFRIKAEQWLKSNRDHQLYAFVNEIVVESKKYLCISEYFDSRFYNCLYVEGDTIIFKIFCLDPSDILDKLQNRALSTIMFSATLTPLDYFSQMLGGDKMADKISLPSAFDPANLCIAVAGYVSMRYNDREDSVNKHVSVIAATVSRKAGNYIAYFPSYESLLRVYSHFKKKYPDVLTVMQKKNMTFSEKEAFLDFFKDDEGVLRIGFCVLGGSFSEGVDLPGARLIGAIVFGVGLPGLSSERNIIRDYYDNRGEVGYDYAYSFPGMNNVLQAAGRVIRRDSDKGIVVLADDRYCDEKYIGMFPGHWNDVIKANNARELAEIIQKFWSKMENT